MKTIKVSDEVWNAIAAQGKFGETEDDVLRRVFKLPAIGAASAEAAEAKSYGWKERRANVRMFQKVTGGKLILEFEGGERREWTLPSKGDSAGIRKVRDEAVAWVKAGGGTDGQAGAAMRALTSRGYHVTLKSERAREYA